VKDLNRKKSALITLISFVFTLLPQSSVAASSKVARGYLLNLSCAADPKLNGDFRVGSNGAVALPYDVTLQVADMEMPSLKAKLEKTYAPYFHGKRSITLSMKQRKYVVKVVGCVI